VKLAAKFKSILEYDFAANFHSVIILA